MLRKKKLRLDIKAVASALKKRHFFFDVKQLTELENNRKKNQIETQNLQNLRNTQSKANGQAQDSGEEVKPFLKDVEALSDELNLAKPNLQVIKSEIDWIVLAIPQITHHSVPTGKSESENVESKKWGRNKKKEM